MNELFNFAIGFSDVIGGGADMLMPDFVQDILGDFLTSIAPYWNGFISLVYGIAGL